MLYCLGLFLQTFSDKLKPEYWLGGQVLERTPAGITILYLAGTIVLIMILGLMLLANFRGTFIFEDGLPREVIKKTGRAIANRSLWVWQFVFVFLALFVYGFHVYWTIFADESNDQFQELSYKDLRNRRTSAATLRGWMLDRSGKLNNALAYYKREQDGDIVRAFSLEKEMAHLLGTERGTPGLERVLYQQKADPMPEAWEVLTMIKRPDDSEKDVKITIDRDLQAYLAKLLEGKKGAIVVLNPQTGDLLGMYSNPSFNLAEAQNLSDYLKLEGNKRDKPLLNRATREYYVPGSTFKTFTMISAFRAGRQDAAFTSSAGGFVPFRGSRAITDANGGCEPPYGCTTLNIAQAFEASSNQYFAQMAVDLGRDRLRETAGLFGISAVDEPDQAVLAKFFPAIWNASNSRIANAIAPQQSTMVTGKGISQYDVALQGMGQGYAGQMTPFQMALVVSAAANMEGKLMKPRIEIDQQPAMFAQVLNPQQAATVRQIMALVTEGSGGTATRVFGGVRGQGIRVGGKTGTAEKQAPLYDERTGRLKTVKKKRKNDKGEWVEYDAPVMYERTDSWFVSFAPLERPQVAIAVVVEGGGYGATVAAPISANVILKARELGLLGDQYKPKTAPKADSSKPTSPRRRQNQ